MMNDEDVRRLEAERDELLAALDGAYEWLLDIGTASAALHDDLRRVDRGLANPADVGGKARAVLAIRQTIAKARGES